MKVTFTVVVIDGQDGSYSSKVIPYPKKAYMEDLKIKHPDLPAEELDYYLMDEGILSIQEHSIEL